MMGQVAVRLLKYPPLDGGDYNETDGSTPRVSAIHDARNERFDGMSPIAEASLAEEPGAEKLHAEICAGVVG